MLSEVRELDQERRAACILPNASLLNTLILVACEEGKLVEARHHVAEMKDARLPPPSPASYVSLVQLCVKENRLDDAWQLLLEMEGQGVALADLGGEARDLEKEVRAKRAAAQAGAAAVAAPPLPRHQQQQQQQQERPHQHDDDVDVSNRVDGGGGGGGTSSLATTGSTGMGMPVIRNLVEDQALSAEEEGRTGKTQTSSFVSVVGGSWPSRPYPMEDLVEQLHNSEEVLMTQ
jgi:pentatricopeptide repeat protein